MIEKIELYRDGLANLPRMVDKINEIIDVVNRLETFHMPIVDLDGPEKPVMCGVKPGLCEIPINGVCGH
jgi:hypothetical protein